jgi:hypothetical protein
MKNDLLDEIRARLEKSTEGWWSVGKTLTLSPEAPVRDREVARCVEDDGGTVIVECDRDVFRARAIDDAELIAHAKADLTALLGLVETYEAALQEVRDLARFESCACEDDLGVDGSDCFPCAIHRALWEVLPEVARDGAKRARPSHE